MPNKIQTQDVQVNQCNICKTKLKGNGKHVKLVIDDEKSEEYSKYNFCMDCWSRMEFEEVQTTKKRKVLKLM